ncbi:MAG: hypothetical protein KDN18_08225 [Verrucomicrobiae bacterium]|nr:hypothetical protein [Verrucomicrobiae bacterium]
MHVLPARTLLGLAWIASLGGSYWAGRTLNPVGAGSRVEQETFVGVTMTPSSGSTTPAEGTDGAGEAEGVGPWDATSADSAPSDLLERARREMGPGMSSMMNPSTMFRALAPLMSLPASEIPAALAEVAATVDDPQQRAMFQSLLLSRWAEEDPKAALGYAEKLATGGGPVEAQALMGVVSTWAKREPEAAWNWYLKRRDSGEAFPGGNGFDGALIAIFGATAANDLDSALAKLPLLDNDSSRNRALMGIAFTAMDGEKRNEILARSGSLDTDTRQSLLQHVLSQWAQTEPDGVMAWLRSQPAGDRTELTNRISYALIGNDPEKAAAFLMEDATEQNAGQRYTTIVSSWANRDPIAAGEWLNRRPKSPAQDQARMNFANQVVRMDPEAAMEWAKSITADETRQASIRNVYQQWSRRDADAANAALGNSGLPDGMIEEIRTRVAN